MQSVCWVLYLHCIVQVSIICQYQISWNHLQISSNTGFTNQHTLLNKISITLAKLWEGIQIYVLSFCWVNIPYCFIYSYLLPCKKKQRTSASSLHCLFFNSFYLLFYTIQNKLYTLFALITMISEFRLQLFYAGTQFWLSDVLSIKVVTTRPLRFCTIHVYTRTSLSDVKSMPFASLLR